MDQSASVIKVEIPGRDCIQVDLEKKSIQVQGCDSLFRFLNNFKTQYGLDPAKWPLPQGRTHHELLVKELILKLTNKWDLPYKEEEMCHCRNITTESVIRAIQMGAHTTQVVSRWTTASTACGTCRPDSEKLIQYLLSQSNPQ